MLRNLLSLSLLELELLDFPGTIIVVERPLAVTVILLSPDEFTVAGDSVKLDNVVVFPDA